MLSQCSWLNKGSIGVKLFHLRGLLFPVGFGLHHTQVIVSEVMGLLMCGSFQNFGGFNGIIVHHSKLEVVHYLGFTINDSGLVQKFKAKMEFLYHF